MAKHFHVLWAVDGVPAHKDLQLRTARALKALLDGLDADVEPVSVVSPDQIRVPADAFREHSEHHRREVAATVRAWAQEAGLLNTKAPTILLQHEFSLRRSTATLREYATVASADLIALGTHARTGLSRAVMGSFAESLTAQSETPLFVVNPDTEPPAEIREVLFATDFGEAARQAFDRLLPIAAAKRGRVTLFYKVEYVLPGTVDLLATYPMYRDYMAHDLARKRRVADEWRAIAARAGVPIEAVFDESTAYVTDAILAAAGRLSDPMIAIASQRGDAAALLGSTTRDVLRQSSRPVWVIHVAAEA